MVTLVLAITLGLDTIGPWSRLYRIQKSPNSYKV